MTPDTPFQHYFSDIEEIPLSDLEARKILGISEEEFTFGLNLGLIKRTVSIHYRLSQNIAFVGLFDLFEYLLRRNFFFLVYKNSPEVNELICSLVDEIAFVVDAHNSFEDSRRSQAQVMANLQNVCIEKQDTWREYWLWNGEKFSVEKCAKITLRTWHSIFDQSMTTIGLKRNLYDI